MNQILLEVCCGSYKDCLIAKKAGATRVELNSALSLGGLTPTIATVRRVKAETSLSVMVMIRSRGAGFCYSDEEFSIMLEDAKEMLDAGADGIVFGCLTSDAQIQLDQTKTMIELIKSYGREVVIHRAFDCIEDSKVAIETYIELGVDRILTAGKRKTAIDGIEEIANLQSTYGNQIEILPGSGLNEKNIVSFLEKTKCTQVHSSCKGYGMDPTTSMKHFGFSYLQEGDFEQTDEQKIIQLLKTLEKVSNHLF